MMLVSEILEMSPHACTCSPYCFTSAARPVKLTDTVTVPFASVCEKSTFPLTLWPVTRARAKRLVWACTMCSATAARSAIRSIALLMTRAMFERMGFGQACLCFPGVLPV